MSRPAVFITAGHKRIGAMLSHSYAKRGYDIGLHYFTDEEAASALQEEIQATYPVRVVLFDADLRDLFRIDNLIDRVFEVFPSVKILVNNAASFVKRPFIHETIDSLSDQMLLNLLAPMALTRGFASKVSQGHVLMISDAKRFYDQRVVYGTSKQALEAFVQQAARELAPSIRVNAIALGWMLPSAEGSEHPQADVLLKRSGTKQDINQAVSFLDDATYVTGEILYIDGGRRLGQ